MDDQRYLKWQQKAQEKWEAKCTRCGACCGLFEQDPCEHLTRLKTGVYACSIYENRFGWRKSISGRRFKCVPIRDILDKSWPGDQHCGYKNKKE